MTFAVTWLEVLARSKIKRKIDEKLKLIFAAQTTMFLLNGLVNITQPKIDPIGMSSGLVGKPMSSGSSFMKIRAFSPSIAPKNNTLWSFSSWQN